MFDTDKSGTIEREEFQCALTHLNRAFKHPLTVAQVDCLFDAIDEDGNGAIEYREFLGAFRLVDRMKKRCAVGINMDISW